MKLSAYLAERKLSDDAFAEQVSRDRTRVMRWRKGQSFPDAESLKLIFTATGGSVTANDFFHAEPPPAEPVVAAA